MKKLFIVASLIATPCYAQQQQTPVEQAMGTKLIQEIQAGLTCSATLIATQAELTKAQARVKELEAAVPKKE
jgi:hypothetical protein